ncbi:MAG: stage V sporulation protein D [Bacillota bacterium]
MLATNIAMRKRIITLFLLTATALGLLIFRLAYIQFFMGDKLRTDALENRMRDIPVEAKRGTIYDRNGRELVTSVSVDSVFAIPSQIKNPSATAQKAAAILQMDPDKVYQLITKKQSFVWIKRKVDYELSRALKKAKAEEKKDDRPDVLDGIGFVEESRREYRKGTLAAHVLGFVGVDNQGLTGIEKALEEELRGIPGRIVMEYDAWGHPIPTAEHKYFKPVQGHNLLLTIDETIQYFVERELDRIVDTFNPANAVIIVMDPKTGEILGMGNRPSYDPNKWSDYPQNTWDRNPAIWYNYEPGSTFKIITLSAAMEEKTVKPTDRFFDPGYVKVADRTIRCWKYGGHGSQSLAEVVQNSCNPGFIKIGLDLGKERFYKYIKGYGFGVTTGIGLPGEAHGILIPEKNVKTLDLATMSIGQSIAVTPIQLVTAVSAAVNGGNLMQPQLVKAVTDNNGRVVKEFKPKIVRRVISEQTSRELATHLENVVLYGTGRNAYIEGYRVGGKTGTAQVVGPSGGYVSGKYVSSFVGFAPVDDPRAVILVMVSEPKGGVYFGSQVAAPSFQAVMQDTLRYLGVPEQKNLPRPAPLNPWVQEEPPVEVTVPQIVNLPLDEAVNDLRAAGLNFVIRGQGSVVYEQIPKAGATVKAGTTVILDLKAGPPLEGQVTVPDVSGLTIKQAGALLESLELRMEPSGTGIAFKQSIAPGRKVDRGTIIKVEFKPPASGPEVGD